jgi:two-component system, OmpR family, KDP operon response regulator KdpE
VSDTATAPNVLVVDDEMQIRRFLRSGFELDGYSVSEAENGREAIRAATLRPTDLIILDLALPDLDGSQVLERIRSWSSVPIIILSVKSSEMEKVRLFELGADDYVTKPFGMAELLARSKVVLRRKARATTGDSVIRIQGLKIDLAARNVFLEDERLTLTPKEYRLLQILAQYPGNVVTHQELLKEIWGLPHINDTHYLRIVVRKLRQKVESDPNQPRILLTELGVGYRLAPPNEPNEAPQAH